MTSLDTARHMLHKWAEWVLHGGTIQSRIGYPQQTVETRAGQGTGRPAPGPVVPTWFRGCAELRVQNIVQSLDDNHRKAIMVQYLLIPELLQQERKITSREKENRWVELTGLDPRTFWRAVPVSRERGVVTC